MNAVRNAADSMRHAADSVRNAPWSSVRSYENARHALQVGAVVWLLLLAAGFYAPGGWTWGMPGPVGHMQNYAISLWLVALVLAPLIAARDPEQETGVVLVYVLGVLAILVSTLRGEPPTLIGDAPPWIAAAITLAMLFWAHPRPSRLSSLLRRA